MGKICKVKYCESLKVFNPNCLSINCYGYGKRKLPCKLCENGASRKACKVNY